MNDLQLTKEPHVIAMTNHQPFRKKYQYIKNKTIKKTLRNMSDVFSFQSSQNSIAKQILM